MCVFSRSKSYLLYFLSLALLFLLWKCSPTESEDIPDNEYNEIIAFYSDRDGNPEIYIMNPDGSDQVRLTNNPFFDVAPAVSPDGSKIIFLTSRHDTSGVFPHLKYEIYTMNLDGSDKIRLTNNAFAEDHVAWNPNGNRISFNADYDADGYQEIYLMNLDGDNLQRITTTNANDQWASWSPDGTKLVFCSDRDGNYEVYTMNSDGNNQIRISHNSNMEIFPEWSPSGDKIAFMYLQNMMTIWSMDINGANRTQLTTEFAESHCWSPDGDEIVFQKWLNNKMEIYSMKADGTDMKNLSNNIANDFWPSWGRFNN